MTTTRRLSTTTPLQSARDPFEKERNQTESAKLAKDQLKSLEDGSTVAKLTHQVLNFGLYGYPDMYLSGAREIAAEYCAPGSKMTSTQVDEMINLETAKGAGVGFITGVAGIIALPIGLPAAVGASWVFQTRLSGAVAVGQGHDIDDPEVQTRVLVSLMGSSTNALQKLDHANHTEQEMLKKFVREFGTARLPLAVVGQVQRLVVREVANQAAKRGATIAAGRAIPVVGGLVGGVIDGISLQKTGHNAYKLFR